MAFQLPQKPSLAPHIAQGSAQRLAFMGQDPMEKYIPKMFDSVQGGIEQAFKKATLKKNMEVVGAYQGLSPEEQALPENKSAFTTAMLGLGLEPPDLKAKTRIPLSEEMRASLGAKGINATYQDEVNFAKLLAPKAPGKSLEDIEAEAKARAKGTEAGAVVKTAATQASMERPSDKEYQASGFAKRAAQAESDLEKLLATGYDPTALLSTRGAAVPNFLKTEQDQQAEQAMRNFVSANLRLESGAAIPIEELANETTKYFPMRGDKPGVLEQKKRARQQVILNLRAEGSRAISKDKPKPGSGDPLGLF